MNGRIGERGAGVYRLRRYRGGENRSASILAGLAGRAENSDTKRVASCRARLVAARRVLRRTRRGVLLLRTGRAGRSSPAPIVPMECCYS